MKERKGISGSTLKIIAIITMLIDHIGAGVLGRLLVVRGMNEAADLNAWIDANSTLVITYQLTYYSMEKYWNSVIRMYFLHCLSD